MNAGLDHVLWIGGAQGAGKSTAARAFAHRKGLRLYFVDAFTYSQMTRRNELIADEIRRSAQQGGLAVVEIDAYAKVGAALEERLRAPAGEPAPEAVQELRRQENLMVVDQIRRYLASDEGPAKPAKAFPLSCECTRLGCVDRVDICLPEHEQLVRGGGFLSAH